MEDKALEDLNQDMKGIAIGRNATAEEDTKYGVDLIFPGHGVQIKPISFYYQSLKTPRFMESCVKRNKKWGMPVVFLYYDRQLEWVNYEKVYEAIRHESEFLLEMATD